MKLANIICTSKALQKRWAKPLACCLLVITSAANVQANPSGAQVIHGSVSFQQNGNELAITNSPNAIINWQDFSVGAQETTRFIQQSTSSSVLNRVVGANPSEILGKLQSNGRVFLINPNGVVFGQGAQIDVNGLIASTLDIDNDDFINGKLKFTGQGGEGNLVHAGTINTPDGGQVVLVAPNVENTGVINAPNGEIILAAGHSVELIDTNNPAIRVQITAEGEAVNIGHLMVKGGVAGIYAGVTKQAGTIEASSAVAEGGKIYLKGSQTLTLAKDSKTVANGKTGGGEIDITSGEQTTIEADARVEANATENGDGGEVIVWSDKNTSFKGHIETKGGSEGGDGGFIEVSGKEYLEFAGTIDTSAPQGEHGMLLLDPTNIDITGATGSPDIDGNGTPGDDITQSTDLDSGTGDHPGVTSFITPGAIATLLNTTSVTLEATNNITVGDAITKTATGETTLTLRAGNNINVNANIESNSGALNMTFVPDYDMNGSGSVVVNDGVTLSPNGGTIDITQGSGTLTYESVTVAAITLNGNTRVKTLVLGADDTINTTVNGTTFTITGTTNFSNANADLQMAVINEGEITISANTSIGRTGEVNMLTQNKGTLTVNADLDLANTDNLVLNGGTLSGSGNIEGNVIQNGGTINPGNSPGILTINGDYHQNGGTLLIEVAGTNTAGVDYDKLDVNGTATLGGTLEVQHIDGFSPTTAGSITDVLVTGTAVNGTFSTILSPGGYAYTADYGATFVNLNYVIVPGDVYDDGVAHNKELDLALVGVSTPGSRKFDPFIGPTIYEEWGNDTRLICR